MFEVEIARGMAWLDEQDTKHNDALWFQRIDTSELALDMHHVYKCVLGQVRPGGNDYDDVIDAFGQQWVADHGFALTVEYGEFGQDWKQLADEWHAAIQQRRSQVAV